MEMGLFCFYTNQPKAEEEDLPEEFFEAWNHDDKDIQSKWRKAIKNEYQQMEELEVWDKKPLNTLPAGQKSIGMKWVFVVKKDGRYRARLVAKGYNQIPGLDYEFSFSPVTTEITLRILLIIWVLEQLYAETADVKTAFLYGTLDEELYINIPPGYKEYLRLNNRTIKGKYL